MDWVDEKLEQFQRRIQNMKFRRAMLAYLLLFAGAAALLSFATMTLCFRWESLIWSRYSDSEDMWVHVMEVTGLFFWPQSYTDFSTWDRVLMQILELVRIWCPFLYMLAAAVSAVMIFYARRLKKPLSILEHGTRSVMEQNLDFEVSYASEDEMGKLCDSFERMRRELVKNEKEMWMLLENQKKVNAAFAHDLRTPLTVLKGYSDFLARFIPEGKVSQEKMVDTLKLMSTHLGRLEEYSRTMKGIRSIDEIPVHREWCPLKDFSREIREVVFALNQIGDIKIRFREEAMEGEAGLDGGIVLEVVENLLSNAIRYAATSIEVTVGYTRAEEKLFLTVRDDGKGFDPKDLEQALLPYYHGHDREEGSHFGLGLHICQLLCEKHDGVLSIANSIKGGAIVTASFSGKSDDKKD